MSESRMRLSRGARVWRIHPVGRAEAEGSAQRLTTLPLADFGLGHAVENLVLVVDSEPPGREPPLDRPSDNRASAPAVRITAALVVARIVDPLDDRPLHV